MLVAEWLIQRYLPDDVIQDEAEYLTVRAAILGKIQATYTGQLPPAADIMAAWATLAPTRFAAVPPRALTPLELSILSITKERAATHISNVTQSMRSKMRDVILEHVQARVLGQKEGTNQHLATRLFDEFGQLNRDFRRIAITESGEASMQGFIASRPVRSRVIRREAYRGACSFCRIIDGRIFTVVDPAKPDKDGETEVWVGKDNRGRSAAPRKRESDRLVERELKERWWVPAGLVHPNCRGVWLAAPDAPSGASPEFLASMEKRIAEYRAKNQGPTGAP